MMCSRYEDAHSNGVAAAGVKIDKLYVKRMIAGGTMKNKDLLSLFESMPTNRVDKYISVYLKAKKLLFLKTDEEAKQFVDTFKSYIESYCKTDKAGYKIMSVNSFKNYLIKLIDTSKGFENIDE